MFNLLLLALIWISETFGLVYCNAATLITDLVCTLVGPHAAMSWTEYILESPWKRVLWILENPGIYSLQVLESPEKQYFIVHMNPGILQQHHAKRIQLPGQTLPWL